MLEDACILLGFFWDGMSAEDRCSETDLKSYTYPMLNFPGLVRISLVEGKSHTHHDYYYP